MSDDTRETKATWPYTSFKTLLNLVQRMEEAKAIPPRVDRSFLGGSEGQKTQVLAALKFFRLIGDNGEVQPLLEQLVSNTKDRPRLVREMLVKHYPDATKLAAVHATTKQLEETFAGLTGATLRKAMTFYLHAAKFAEHAVSKHFKVPYGLGGRHGTRRPRSSGAHETPGASSTAIPATPADPKARYLDLLLEKAKAANGTLDTTLLDRIERLLGLPGSKLNDEDGHRPA